MTTIPRLPAGAAGAASTADLDAQSEINFRNNVLFAEITNKITARDTQASMIAAAGKDAGHVSNS
jgi:hypothetical protein